jgi:hypothetical protein
MLPAIWLRVRVFQLVDQPQLQVVLQVAADAWQFVPHLDTERLEHAGRADPRALQNSRRAHGAGAQHDFLACLPAHRLAVLTRDPLGGAAVFQQHTVDFDVGQHGEVGPLADRLEKRLGRVRAPRAFWLTWK